MASQIHSQALAEPNPAMAMLGCWIFNFIFVDSPLICSLNRGDCVGFVKGEEWENLMKNLIVGFEQGVKAGARFRGVALNGAFGLMVGSTYGLS